MTESEIEIAICHFLASKNIFFWKNHTGGFFDPKRKIFRRQANPYAINGAPDIISIINGVFVGFEVKSEKGKQTDSQKQFEERTKRAGGLYFVVRSAAEVNSILLSLK